MENVVHVMDNAMQYVSAVQANAKQYYDIAQDWTMKTWTQYSEAGAQYFDTLVPGHGFEIVVALAAVAVTTAFLLFMILPCCLCGCCGRRRRGRKNRAPVVLMVGISGAGKTAAVSRLVYGEMSETRMSQAENVIPDVDIGDGVRATVVDTPGHQRVRSAWHNYIGASAGARAATHIVFVVNSVDARAEAYRIAEFLYDILSDPIVQDEELPLLLLCTKSDMQTALPVENIIPLIERQLQQLREAAQIDAHDKRDIVSENVDESVAFTFDNATCHCTFAPASARTGKLDAIAQFVREQ